MKLFFSSLMILSSAHAQDIVYTFKNKDFQVEVAQKFMKEHAPETSYAFVQKDNPCDPMDYTKILFHVCFEGEDMKFVHLNTTDLPRKYALLFQKDFEEMKNETY